MDSRDRLEDAQSLGFNVWYCKNQDLDIIEKLRLFQIEIPEFIAQDIPAPTPQQLFYLLKRAFSQHVGRRTKLPQCSSVQQVADLLKSCKNILVLTGAGVSVSCGIPDFRSENGIYSRLAEFNLDDPQQMFDLAHFRNEPETFYAFAKELYPSNFTPSSSHCFIRYLQDYGVLLRNYTQNIDTLEQQAGIVNVLQCHGSFATASCIACRYQVPGSAIEPYIMTKTVPKCTACSIGLVKPDIIFFGESLPDTFEQLFQLDVSKVDLMIVMGSSLKVAPVADIIYRVPFDVPQVLINLEPLSNHALFDIQLLGECDVITRELMRLCGWADCKPQCDVLWDESLDGFLFKKYA